MLATIIGLGPELLKLIPWFGMLGAMAFAYFRHTQATNQIAKANEQSAEAAQTVATITAASAQANQTVADTSKAAVQTASEVSSTVAAQPDDAVRTELQNEFGRKD